jgi:Protein of unknown function (DUF1566)
MATTEVVDGSLGSFAARCVRAGKTASGGYSAANGTVLDTATGLTWQRSVVGTNYYDWDDAPSACSDGASNLPGTGWLLPSIKELATFVDFGLVAVAIDPAAFPGTPDADYWSSSPEAGSPGIAWMVSRAREGAD